MGVNAPPDGLNDGVDAARIDPITGAPSLDSTETETTPPPISEELSALVEDGKTYAEAEFAFQKTRFSFAADRGKSVLLLGLLAVGLVHLMLIALVVGSVIALSPMVGGWAAMGIVVGALLFATIISALIIRSKIKQVSEAFAKKD